MKGTLIYVDNMLTMAKIWEELKARMPVLFSRFRALNVKDMPSKLRLGTRVTFDSFQCETKEGKFRILPYPKRLEAMVDINLQGTKQKSEHSLELQL